MCGFVGVIAPPGDKVDSSVIQTMLGPIHHRGPDDQGIVCEENIGLGFNRLSIVDLSPQGHQPMFSHDRSLLLVFNGEIYNAPELKAQYCQGYSFQSNTDTEVILALYHALGFSGFEKLNGMFAFALWDKRLGKLYLVRDRLGIKPLYYTELNGNLVFGSEIKALRQYPGFTSRMNREALVEHFTFQYTFGDKTLYQGVEMVSPGTALCFEGNRSSLKSEQSFFWKFQYQHDYARSIEDFAKELRETLQQVLHRQIRSDVPVGAFLSGGMDTSSIAALAMRDFKEMHTFTCGFDVRNAKGHEIYCDETAEAEAMSHLLGTTHHTLKLDHQAMPSLFASTVESLEDPRVGISYQMNAIAKVVRQYCTVVLSGTGGDELFGGYHWRYMPAIEHDTGNFDDRLYQQCARLDASHLLSQECTPYLSSPRDSFNRVMKQCDAKDPLDRALYVDVQGFLRGLLLVDDKLNMAHSVESRVPLLDNDMIDLALKIPAQFKFDGTTTKRVLKKALEGILPNEVIHRRKQGFTPPDAAWFRTVNRAFVRNKLLSDEFLDAKILNREGVHRILQEHDEEKNDHRFLIWSMMSIAHLQTHVFEKQTQQVTEEKAIA